METYSLYALDRASALLEGSFVHAVSILSFVLQKNKVW